MNQITKDVDRRTFLAESQRELDRWRKTIADKKVELRRKAEGSKTELGRKVEDLSRRSEILKRRLREASNVAEESWREIHGSLRQAMKDFREGADLTFDALKDSTRSS